eukprot:3194726-Rhodomonas_salina.1
MRKIVGLRVDSRTGDRVRSGMRLIAACRITVAAVMVCPAALLRTGLQPEALSRTEGQRCLLQQSLNARRRKRRRN